MLDNQGRSVAHADLMLALTRTSKAPLALVSAPKIKGYKLKFKDSPQLKRITEQDIGVINSWLMAQDLSPTHEYFIVMTT